MNDSGFSVTAMVVGGVLAVILGAVAGPHWIRARISANEAEAVADTRTVVQAELSFASANCGYFDDVKNLCREGGECGGIQIPGYDGPDFLSKELGRISPYEKSGYERTWSANGTPERFRDCQPAPTAVLDYCYTSAPLTSWSGSRAFGGSGSGAVSMDPTGTPLPCPIPVLCIREGVRVQTPSGPTPVEKLSIGDEVWARGADGSPSVNEVVATRHGTVDGHLRLTFDDGSRLEVTEVHPISTTEGWRAAGMLRPGDIVDGLEETLRLERVDRVPGQAVVYDLTVAPDACFYANGILVHNKIIE